MVMAGDSMGDESGSLRRKWDWRPGLCVWCQLLTFSFHDDFYSFHTGTFIHPYPSISLSLYLYFYLSFYFSFYPKKFPPPPPLSLSLTSNPLAPHKDPNVLVLVLIPQPQPAYLISARRDVNLPTSFFLSTLRQQTNE